MASWNEAELDFENARKRARFQSIFSTFRWKNPNLLSFYEVTKLVKPEAESYKGMQTIPVSAIIGSECRSHDFSSGFYPRSNALRRRWESIDLARMDDVVLPPISVYKVGDVYFVRDGNHRVSVAKSEGQAFIDAEVIELSVRIQLKEGMTMNEIKKLVVSYERQAFLDQYHPSYLPMERIVFTEPGFYPEMVNHILVHKYYKNQTIHDRELSFEEAAVSWYENVYAKIVEAVEEEHLASEFPGQSSADIYMLLVKRWDETKRINNLISEDEMAKIVHEENRKERWNRWRKYLSSLFSRQ